MAARAALVAALLVAGAAHAAVPLDPQSPWPKFRRDALQQARGEAPPVDSGRPRWTFHTGKGVFSSPVVDGDGTVYVGSADRTFYALDRDGRLRWRLETGEIIDSAALLDDRGRVYVPSGDGHLYALERRSGDRVWTFAAADAAETGAFINWFEGNVAIGGDGTLYAPNDNFCTYAIDRERGTARWCFRARDQVWSLPALDPADGHLFGGNNFAFFRNLHGLDSRDGRVLWHAAAGGSVAASPLLTASGADGMVVVGAFDGFLRAHDPATGAERWRLGVRDHLYASPAQLSDGTIIQPGADGSIYAVRPDDGLVRWAFDTVAPIRSSPAVDGDDNIYVGTGDGRLLVLNPDGTARWSLRLIDGPRDDLNSSPALGPDAIVIGGEDGTIHAVPYDYCLRPRRDPACRVGGGEELPDDGAALLYTTSFGTPLRTPPAAIEANQPLAFTLLVRRGGDTELALLDAATLQAVLDPPAPADVTVSGDRRFLTIIPRAPFAGPAGGRLGVSLRGTYDVEPERAGLRFRGGRAGGRFDQPFAFDVRPRGGAAPPLAIRPGQPEPAWELYRLAAPLPSILPSYNQIGFDSIHYLIGLVRGDGAHGVAWAIAGRPGAAGGATVPDPAARVRFPLVVDWDGGLLTMANEAGFTIAFNGWPMPFQLFRVAARIDAQGRALASAAINSRAVCGAIDFYGAFLQELGYCHPRTDTLEVFGGAELRPWAAPLPPAVGAVRFAADLHAVSAELVAPSVPAEQHVVSLLLLDHDGRPLPLDYSGATQVEAGADGLVRRVSIPFRPGSVRGLIHAYLLLDTGVVASADLPLPEELSWALRLRLALGEIWARAQTTVGDRVRTSILHAARWWEG
ncbi:MAG: PQQ-binding-like beta-propeller repeat protein [Candidatus Binatia bacterium]